MEKWMASKARWMEEEGTWRVSNLRRRWWDEEGEHFERLAVLDTALAMQISDFGQRNEAMSTLGRTALREAIEREKTRGSGGERLLQLERHAVTPRTECDSFALLHHERHALAQQAQRRSMRRRHLHP